MLYDNIEKLIAGIAIVTILLICCIAVDSADETITADNSDSLQNIPKGTIIINDSYMLDKNSSMAVSDGKVHVDKSVKTKPTITMTGRPSCTRCARNHRAYKWSTHTYINYCPNCHHYNCLGNKHKRGSVHEKEITCFRCDSDFCVRCGKEKYSWSRKNLTPA